MANDLTYDADYRRYAANEIVEICFDQSDEFRLAGSCAQSCSDLRATALSAQKPTSRRTFLQAAGHLQHLSWWEPSAAP